MAPGNLSKRTILFLKLSGFPLIYLRRCSEDLSSFSVALSNAIDNNEYGPFVDKHSPEELRESGASLFLSRDKMAGVGVWPDGNIRAVFRDRRSKAGRAVGELMLTAIEAGGKKLDCYDGRLRYLYALFGFIPVARVKFDPQYAPANWKDRFGTPDIIFWVHCGDPTETVAQKIAKYRKYTDRDIQALPCFDDYDEACRYRDKILEDPEKLDLLRRQ